MVKQKGEKKFDFWSHGRQDAANMSLRGTHPSCELATDLQIIL